MSSAQIAACPKCGFSYGWDGNRCRHCKHGSEDESQDTFVSLDKVREVLARSAADELVVNTFGRCWPSPNSAPAIEKGASRRI